MLKVLERRLAPHVQAAISAAAQPKNASEPATRPVAPHLQAQMAARVRPTRTSSEHGEARVRPLAAGRPLAAHVRSATANPLVLQRAAEKGKKAAHTTRRGRVKASSIDYLKALPKGSKPADVIGIWEKHHSVLDEFADTDPDGLPPGTTGNLPDLLDLADLQGEYYVLGKMLADAVAAVGPDASRGEHGNDEGKLPTYPGASPYEEFSFFKGGGRLVVDHTANRTYVSLHYSTFYRVA
jgi:hypothetical protein